MDLKGSFDSSDDTDVIIHYILLDRFNLHYRVLLLLSKYIFKKNSIFSQIKIDYSYFLESVAPPENRDND